MNMSFRVSQEQNMKLAITPELMQSFHILQLSGYELEQFLQDQTVENPVLEIEVQSNTLNTRKKSKRNNDTISADELWNVRAAEEVLDDILLSQMRFLRLDPETTNTIKYLIGNLNDDGYLPISLSEVCDALNVSAHIAEDALRHLQAMEPYGIGARDLKECLQLQIKRDDNAVNMSYVVVEHYLSTLAQGRLDRIASELGISEEEVLEILRYIRSLNPRPGLHYSRVERQYIIPDATIHKGPEGFIITMNKRFSPRLSVNHDYYRMANESSHPEVSTFLKERMKSAQWIIRSMDFRKHTLTKVIQAIVEEQWGFFDSGINGIRPMNMKLISEKIGMHESTISRAVNRKYIQTPAGVFELKYFFSSGLETEGGASTSTTKVKSIIKDLVATESKRNPLSDQKIANYLEKEGVRISRRTVTKYREEMNILSSVYRKRIG